MDGSTTRTAAILGSAQYLSPEQSRGEDATEQSDIYACGVVLYEMLSGHPPFDGPNALAIAHHHLRTAPTPLNLQGGTRLEAAVIQALAKDPDARFSSASEFSSAIDAPAAEIQDTTFQPLSKGEDRRFTPNVGARRVPDERGPGMVVRRSSKKSYLLGAGLAAGALAAAYAATLPLWGSLPSHPSVPYWILPLACFAVAMYSWVNARSWIYTLDQNVAAVQWGLVSHRRFGVPIRHITTIELKQSPIDRVLGVGTIEMCARDQFGDERRLAMEDIPHPRQTYEELMRILGQAISRESTSEAFSSPEHAR